MYNSKSKLNFHTIFKQTQNNLCYVRSHYLRQYHKANCAYICPAFIINESQTRGGLPGELPGHPQRARLCRAAPRCCAAVAGSARCKAQTEHGESRGAGTRAGSRAASTRKAPGQGGSPNGPLARSAPRLPVTQGEPRAPPGPGPAAAAARTGAPSAPRSPPPIDSGATQSLRGRSEAPPRGAEQPINARQGRGRCRLRPPPLLPARDAPRARRVPEALMNMSVVQPELGIGPVRAGDWTAEGRGGAAKKSSMEARGASVAMATAGPGPAPRPAGAAPAVPATEPGRADPGRAGLIPAAPCRAGPGRTVPCRTVP